MRLSVSDENYNDARVAFIKENNWTNVAIIHQDSIEYSLVKNLFSIDFHRISPHIDGRTISQTFE